MAQKTFSWFKNQSPLEIAIVIAIVIGVCITVVLIFELKNEQYSTLYLYPESYQNYPDSPVISFVYGIHSYEQAKTSYTVRITLNSLQVDTKTIDLNPGETYEEKKVLQLPSDLQYPAKVSITGTSTGSFNEVHYWLKTHPPDAASA
jgi:uncharacterized membrane protein